MRKSTVATKFSGLDCTRRHQNQETSPSQGTWICPLEEHSCQSRQLSQQHRERERIIMPYQLAAHIYKNRGGNPLGSWTDTHPKEKKNSISILWLKCDLSGQTSLKQSAVTRHNVPKNMVISRATLVHKARSARFGNSRHPAGGHGVGEGVQVPGRRRWGPVSIKCNFFIQ